MTTTPRTDLARTQDNGDPSWVFDEMGNIEHELSAAKAALNGFLTKGENLGVSHPHLIAYFAFPDEVWQAARAVLEETEEHHP